MSVPISFRDECRRLTLNQEGLPDFERLRILLDRHWKYTLSEFPEQATYLGYPEYNDRWSDASLSSFDRRRDDVSAALDLLKSMKRAGLSEQDALSYDLFLRERQIEQQLDQFGQQYLAISQLDGIQQEVPRIMSFMTLMTSLEHDQFLSRLNALPMLIEQSQALLEEGIKRQIVPPRLCLRELPQQILKLTLDDESLRSRMLGVGRLDSRVPSDTRKKFRIEAREVLDTKVIPAWRRFHQFIEQSYLPACREEIPWSRLPNGKDWYAYQVRRHTTTDLTPEQIHEIGKSEVGRIRSEMERLIKAIGYKGDFHTFCEELRTNPKFFCKSADELLTRYRNICKRIDPELTAMFGRLPRLPYGVTQILDYAAPSQTTAYYEPGSPQGHRPGYFFANTYNLSARPIWEMEALTLHEAVPGHHLQIALMQELTDLPLFRQNLWITSFGEGWALYAEQLGNELEIYSDEYSMFGQLTYEMWRAVRLVVDTGIHALGWSRDQAIEYFMAQSSKTRHDVTVEIDRYIVWPGQSLAYKIGELKIRELRASAEKSLGERFDIRAFHDELLRHGCLPLDVLERRVMEWVGGEEKA